jgi:hypothetical protein
VAYVKSPRDVKTLFDVTERCCCCHRTVGTSNELESKID